MMVRSLSRNKSKHNSNKCINQLGHGGPEAATFAKQNLAKNIFTDPQFLTDTKACITQAFQQTDTEFNKIANEAELYCGTTAVTIIIQGTKYVLCCVVCYSVVLISICPVNRLITANLGDSRAVLCNGIGVARALSIDHKPSRYFSDLL